GRVLLRSHVLQVVHARSELHGPDRPPRLPALREDLDHAAGRLRAVQCRRGRTLHDLDPFDVFRRDVVQRQQALAGCAAGQALLAVDADAVHVNERRVALAHAAVPAQPDRAPGPGLPGIRQHGHAGGPATDHVLCVADGREFDLLPADPGETAAHLALAGLAGRARDLALAQ